MYALDPQATSEAPALDISGLAPDLRFDGTPDRLPEHFTGQHLQSMRRLTDSSAERLASAGGHARPPALALNLFGRYGRREVFQAVGVQDSSRLQAFEYWADTSQSRWRLLHLHHT
jgi:hypothetical protein